MSKTIEYIFLKYSGEHDLGPGQSGPMMSHTKHTLAHQLPALSYDREYRNPTYRRNNLLTQAVRSCLNQCNISPKDYEIVVVDNFKTIVIRVVTQRMG